MESEATKIQDFLCWPSKLDSFWKQTCFFVMMKSLERGELQRSEQVNGGGDDEKWVADSSVDYKGRVPLRASTGAWKASLFIIGKGISIIPFPLLLFLPLFPTFTLHRYFLSFFLGASNY